VSRIFNFSLMGLFCALATVSLATSASANGMRDFETICHFDCSSVLAPIEDPLTGTDFEFEIALKAISDGLAISVTTPGSVYIVGDVAATGQLKMSGAGFYIDANTLSESLRLYGDDFEPIEVYVASVLTSADLDLGSGYMSPDVTLTTFGVDLGIVDEVKGDKRPHFGRTTTHASIVADGDIYLDLSMVKLSRLFVNAGGSIVLSQDPGMMIPEPSTALLMGLGLAALSGATHRLRP
jgi:hypothetical protein